MQNSKIITLVVVALGLITTILFVGHYSTNCLRLVWIPYAILFGLIMKAEGENGSNAAKMSVLITASFVCIISGIAYYETSYGTSRSSTEALIFLILPIQSIVIIPIMYVEIKRRLAFLNRQDAVEEE